MVSENCFDLTRGYYRVDTLITYKQNMINDINNGYGYEGRIAHKMNE